MLAKPDPYSQAFIDYAKHALRPVLDIGAAYGVASIPSLREGAHVIANDLDPRHLEILECNTPAFLRPHLRLMPGQFPTEMFLSANSISAVLASGVLHYLPPDKLQEAFKKIHTILEPGGKFFFFTSTPYLPLFQEFLPRYQLLKASGHPWPGLIEDSWLYAPHRKAHIPKRIHLFEIDTLTPLFQQAGFSIEDMNYTRLEDSPADIQASDKGYIGVVAVKS